MKACKNSCPQRACNKREKTEQASNFNTREHLIQDENYDKSEREGMLYWKTFESQVDLDFTHSSDTFRHGA